MHASIVAQARARAERANVLRVEFVSIRQQAFGVIAIGQEAQGVLAIGQLATGIVAIGQMATGVIAVGQVARGFVAVGMVSIGLFPVGMLAVGVFAARALIGAAALGGKLAVAPLMPFPRMNPYGIRKPDELVQSGQAGFVFAQLAMGGDRVPRLLDEQGRELPAQVATDLLEAARTRASGSTRHVLAYLEPEPRGRTFVAQRLVAVPEGAASLPVRLAIWTASLGALLAIMVGFYATVVLPLVELAVRLYQAP